MKNILVVFILSAMLISCKNNTGGDGEIQEEVRVEAPANKPVWKITGTEPFWNMYIHEDTVMYTRLNEKIDSIYFEIHHYSDRDSLVEFHLTDINNIEAGLVLRRSHTFCSDGMSDNQYEYSASFNYRKEKLKGCASKK